ncbi:baseplate wedge subunit [Mergibacter septicus]|uniref:GPW/gp25 family protein n=1 Tax=Mergibacter septicus TaxID=221402 RepID=UPI001C744A21|nr:GPW/gp25 family protein [Mergibacter septicus]QDJ13077.1 baseplate wedge subunit [Mergibacter septicus]
MNNVNGHKIENQQQHIRQSIRDILLTPIGSRLQRRDYGSYLPFLLDRPINHALLLQISSASVMALKRWEPRLQINSFVVAINGEGKLIAEINGILNTNNSPLSYQQRLN